MQGIDQTSQAESPETSVARVMLDDEDNAAQDELAAVESASSSPNDSLVHWSLDNIALGASVDLTKITAGQLKVLQSFINEPNEARVARQLGLSKQTVYNHLASAQRILKITSRAELVKAVFVALSKQA